MEDAAEIERNLAGILFATEDKIEGVDAFLNKKSVVQQSLKRKEMEQSWNLIRKLKSF